MMIEADFPIQMRITVAGPSEKKEFLGKNPFSSAAKKNTAEKLSDVVHERVQIGHATFSNTGKMPGLRDHEHNLTDEIIQKREKGDAIEQQNILNVEDYAVLDSIRRNKLRRSHLRKTL